MTLNNVALLETVADSRHVVRTQRLSVDSAPATFGELVHGRRARADEWVCMLWSRKSLQAQRVLTSPGVEVLPQ